MLRFRMLKLKTLTAAVALAMAAGTAQAQVSGNVVKIGVMSDMSSLYADIGGPGSVVAARMAVEDFGAGEKGTKGEIGSAGHPNKPHVRSSVGRQWQGGQGGAGIVDGPTCAA